MPKKVVCTLKMKYAKQKCEICQAGIKSKIKVPCKNYSSSIFKNVIYCVSKIDTLILDAQIYLMSVIFSESTSEWLECLSPISSWELECWLAPLLPPELTSSLGPVFSLEISSLKKMDGVAYCWPHQHIGHWGSVLSFLMFEVTTANYPKPWFYWFWNPLILLSRFFQCSRRMQNGKIVFWMQ